MRIQGCFSLLIFTFVATILEAQWARPGMIEVEGDPVADQKNHDSLVKAIDVANVWIREQTKDFNSSGALPENYKPDPSKPTHLAPSQNYWFGVDQVRKLAHVNKELADKSTPASDRSNLEKVKTQILHETKEFAESKKEAIPYVALGSYLYNVERIDKLLRESVHGSDPDTRKNLDSLRGERTALVEILVNVGPIIKDEVLELRTELYKRERDPALGKGENLQAVINELDYLLAKIDEAEENLTAEEFWKNYMDRIGKPTCP